MWKPRLVRFVHDEDKIISWKANDWNEKLKSGDKDQTYLIKCLKWFGTNREVKGKNKQVYSEMKSRKGKD